MEDVSIEILLNKLKGALFMFTLTDLSKYKENNRLEAKLAQKGLPRSLWETYSAFANTNGGVILLGVEEKTDKTLNIIGVPNAEELVKDFFDNINNPQKVSINYLTDRHICIEEANGKSIVVIDIPRAERTIKPVYINNNIMSGTYRRNGEGDYHCTEAEMKNMLRDSGNSTQDQLVLEKMGYTVFDFDSIKRFRMRMSNLKQGHVWEGLEDNEFLLKLGAVGRGEDGKLHPTAAGLLMFGFEYEIVREFPNYFLDYRENFDNSTRWTDRIVSSSGDWSGNIFDFYFRVYNKIVDEVKVPFKLENGTDRIDDTPVHKALREALANALIHANYYERQGLIVEKRKKEIILSNPGGLRISHDEAISGGKSDPRNATIIKMFNLINIGERAGSGLPNIHAVWKNEKWSAPKFIEEFNPDRTILTLSLKKSAIKIGDKKSAIKVADKKTSIKQKNFNLILSYLSRVAQANVKEISTQLELKESRARDYLRELAESGDIVAEGANRNRTYKLK